MPPAAATFCAAIPMAWEEGLPDGAYEVPRVLGRPPCARGQALKDPALSGPVSLQGDLGFSPRGEGRPLQAGA